MAEDTTPRAVLLLDQVAHVADELQDPDFGGVGHALSERLTLIVAELRSTLEAHRYLATRAAVDVDQLRQERDEARVELAKAASSNIVLMAVLEALSARLTPEESASVAGEVARGARDRAQLRAERDEAQAHLGEALERGGVLARDIFALRRQLADLRAAVREVRGTFGVGLPIEGTMRACEALFALLPPEAPAPSAQRSPDGPGDQGKRPIYSAPKAGWD